jgi:hypothetical protein
MAEVLEVLHGYFWQDGEGVSQALLESHPSYPELQLLLTMAVEDLDLLVARLYRAFSLATTAEDGGHGTITVEMESRPHAVDPARTTLHVRLISGRNLSIKDHRTKSSDPYVIIDVLPPAMAAPDTATSKHHSKKLNPSWNQTFDFVLQKVAGDALHDPELGVVRHHFPESRLLVPLASFGFVFLEGAVRMCQAVDLACGSLLILEHVVGC